MSEETSEQKENKPTKKWHKVKVFDTYDEASALKTELMNESGNSDLQVKIKRCGDRGTQFKVKTYRPKK